MIPLPRLLDSNLNEIRRIRPISVSITEDIVPLSTASMRLMPEDSVPYRSYVELFTPNGSAGVYRAKMPTERYGNPDNSVNLEHAICELGDYIVKGTIEQEVKTLVQAVTQVFGYYGGSRWQLGAVNVTADVLISADYSNVLQTINSLIEQAPGAMMAFDFSTTPWTFSIVAVEGSVSAEGRLSRNISSAEISRNDSELCTRVWLNHIASTAEQSYMDADTIGTYGVIERVLTDRNYTTPQAQQVASKYLAKHKHPTYSVQIDGLDLSSITGESLDRFAIGKKFRLTIPEDQQKIEETIVNLSWYDVYENPTAVRVTLSEHAETETSIIGNLSSEVYGTKANSTRSRTYLNQTDYKIELVAEEVETLDGRVDDAETELTKKYTIRSGIAIEPAGVEISGGKYVDIKSGSTLEVESGGDVNVKSGGDLNIKSGGKVNVESGADIDVKSGGDLNIKSGGKATVESGADLDVNSGGDVNVKSGGKVTVESGADLDVNSGGDINVKSGGNLKVASGGNIDIQGTGTLALTGSTVSIKSGSTFNVESDNIKINSSEGEFTTINKYNGINDDFVFSIGRNYGQSDLRYVAYYLPSQSAFTNDGVTRYTYPLHLTIIDKVSVPNYTKRVNMRLGTVYQINPETAVAEYMPIVAFDATSKYGNTTSNERVFLYCANGIFDNYLYASKGRIGTLNATTITYVTLNSNSSRDIKHNISPLPSIGEKLDQLKPVTFVYDDDEQEKTRMGLIYEDTVEVMPEICTDDESNKAINYVELIPALLKEIQDLRARVAELERGAN